MRLMFCRRCLWMLSWSWGATLVVEKNCWNCLSATKQIHTTLQSGRAMLFQACYLRTLHRRYL